MPPVIASLSQSLLATAENVLSSSRTHRACSSVSQPQAIQVGWAGKNVLLHLGHKFDSELLCLPELRPRDLSFQSLLSSGPHALLLHHPAGANFLHSCLHFLLDQVMPIFSSGFVIAGSWTLCCSCDSAYSTASRALQFLPVLTSIPTLETLVSAPLG